MTPRQYAKSRLKKIDLEGLEPEQIEAIEGEIARAFTKGWNNRNALSPDVIPSVVKRVKRVDSTKLVRKPSTPQGRKVIKTMPQCRSGKCRR